MSQQNPAEANVKRRMNVKVIEEPAANQYAASQFEALYGERRHTVADFNSDASDLKPKYRAANFSGPGQLKQLDGLCFDFVSNDYRWHVCPFHNVTQFEQVLRWNPFKGILGIWYEWEIVENKFVSMVMQNGDECGSSGPRQTRVHFKCDNNAAPQTRVDEVSEPSTCNYKVVLSTPLVCEQPTQSMNVYPSLDESSRAEWDRAYTELTNGLITEKMYNLTLRVLFERAGLYRTKHDDELLKLPASNADEDEHLVPIGQFGKTATTRPMTTGEIRNYQESEPDFQAELAECKLENQRLKALLESITNTTSNSSTTNTTTPTSHVS